MMKGMSSITGAAGEATNHSTAIWYRVGGGIGTIGGVFDIAIAGTADPRSTHLSIGAQ